MRQGKSSVRVVSTNRRVPVPPAAAAAIRELNAQVKAAQNLADAYLAGLCVGLGVNPANVLGLEGDELVTEEPDAARLPRAASAPDGEESEHGAVANALHPAREMDMPLAE